MKLSLIVLSLMAIACGRYEATGTNRGTVGEVRNLAQSQSAATTGDRDAMISVCNALAAKSAVLPQSVNSSHLFTFSQSDCAGNTITTGDAEAVIQNVNGTFVFKRRTDGLDFIFPNVETTDSGIFSDICTNISNLTNPVVGTNEATYFTTAGIETADCTPLANEVCMVVEKASVQGATATVHTREWIRVRTGGTQGKIGFFTQRKKITQSFCAPGESIMFQATMK